MDYKVMICPICGSENIKEISKTASDDNIFHTYKCNSCDENFSTRKVFELIQKTERKKEEKINKPIISAATIFKNNAESVVEISCLLNEAKCLGTGIIISSSGYVITNAHIIMEISQTDKIDNLSETIFGNFNKNNENYELEFVTADPQHDIALLKFTDKIVKPVIMAKNEVETGEDIFVIGNSKGEGMCILEGIVSDKCRKVVGNDYIMITAQVTNGNSGGPVFNANGEMVGMVTSGRKDAQAMNYAISTKTIVDFIKEVEIKEEIRII